MASLPVSLTRRGWGFVLGAGVVAIAGLLAQFRDFWYLPALLAAVPVLSLLIAMLVRVAARLEVRLSASNPTPSAESTVELTASLSHRLPMTLDARANWLIEHETSSTDVSIPRGIPARITHEWHAMHRGPAEVRVHTVCITDPLGVAVATVKIDKRAMLANALVLPKLLEQVPDTDESSSSGDLAALPPTRLTQDSGIPGGSLRKYWPGDAKRQVDWKQSARQNELLVRIAEADEASARSLVIRTDAAGYASRHEFEFAISEVATLAVAWLRIGVPVQLVIDNVPALDGVDEDELLRLLAHLELKPGVYAAE